MRNIAEGANRVHPRDKAARFIVALGECEAALELAPWSEIGRMRRKANRVAALVHGLVRCQQLRADGTADTALRLGIFFGVSPETWVGLQANCDLRVTERTSGEGIAKRVRPHVA